MYYLGRHKQLPICLASSAAGSAEIANLLSFIDYPPGLPLDWSTLRDTDVHLIAQGLDTHRYNMSLHNRLLLNYHCKHHCPPWPKDRATNYTSIVATRTKRMCATGLDR